MAPMPADAALQAALEPPNAVPVGPAWNLDELRDLLPERAALADAAVLVPLAGDRDTRVILTRRHDGLRHHGGQVSFPGGRVDPGDAGPLAAALREAEEEIGLPRDDARVLGYLDPLATISGFRVLPVVARVPADFEPRPRPGEVAEVFSLPLSWLMDPVNLARIAIHYRGQERHVFEYQRHEAAPGQRVWGATASILYNLRQRLLAAGGLP
jgi:8-oxo-dGTP pyrophosphatase MutT (NUDIX family)